MLVQYCIYSFCTAQFLLHINSLKVSTLCHDKFDMRELRHFVQSAFVLISILSKHLHRGMGTNPKVHTLTLAIHYILYICIMYIVNYGFLPRIYGAL